MIVVLPALACHEINVHLIRQNECLYELGGEERREGKLCPATLNMNNCLFMEDASVRISLSHY